MGGAFGASGFDGTDGFEASSKLFKDGVNAFKNVMKTTVHPKVKQAANLVKKETFKHIKNEIKDSFIGNVLDSVVGYIVGELSSLFFGG